MEGMGEIWVGRKRRGGLEASFFVEKFVKKKNESLNLERQV
jgi:hypothetical protein